MGELHRGGGGPTGDGEPGRGDGASGDGEPGRADVEGLVARLHSASESERVVAAYGLGVEAPVGSVEARGALGAGLSAAVEGVRRAAGLGLRQAGAAGVDVLLDGARHRAAPVRRPALAGLGTRHAARRADALAALIGALTDPDDLARSNAAYALGQAGRCPDAVPELIADAAVALLARLAPGAEADNATNHGFRRSTVRQSAAYGLMLLVTNHPLPDPLLDRIVTGPAADDDRYVQGMVVEGLARARHLPDGARRHLVSTLAARRWSPTPTA